MSGTSQQLKALGFDQRTGRSFAEVVGSCRQAAELSSGTLTKFSCAVDNSDQTVVVDLKRGGMVEWARCLVIYRESAGDGAATVSLTPLRWMTSKPTFLFIPIGPEKAPAESYVSKFSRALTAAL